MKEKITSLVLVLVVAMSMTVGASAASYIPDDVTYQNLNGQQLAIKTYTLLPTRTLQISMKRTSSMMASCTP